MFKSIISKLTRYIIPFISRKHWLTRPFDYKSGTQPADFVGINPDQPLSPKVIFNQAGIPTGVRILDGDGIWFKAFTVKYESLENRHFDSIDTFHHFHDQIGG